MLRVIFLAILFISSISILNGCSTDEKKLDAPEAAFNSAAEYDKDERYDEAIKRYQDVKNKFPYSKYAIMAELAVSDVYFKQESFAEAQVSYQSFKDLHPKHPKIDYVTYRLAMSFYSQLPPTIDRDLSLAGSTILYFDEVISQFPNSDYVKESKEKKEATLKMLASKEDYIGEFYFKRGKYESSLTRYEGLLKKYSGLGFDAKALSRAYICAQKVGDPDRAKKFMSDLESKFAGSPELEFAKKGVE